MSRDRATECEVRQQFVPENRKKMTRLCAVPPFRSIMLRALVGTRSVPSWALLRAVVTHEKPEPLRILLFLVCDDVDVASAREKTADVSFDTAVKCRGHPYWSTTDAESIGRFGHRLFSHFGRPYWARPSRAPRTVSSGRGDAWSTRALMKVLESPSSGREGPSPNSRGCSRRNRRVLVPLVEARRPRDGASLEDVDLVVARTSAPRQGSSRSRAAERVRAALARVTTNYSSVHFAFSSQARRVDDEARCLLGT
jgi:hypothetical protein